MQGMVIATRDEQGGASLASGVTSVILGPYNLQLYPTKAFSVYNCGSATLSGAVIQTNPDPGGNESQGGSSINATMAAPNAGLWETYDESSFINLASGGVRTVYVIDKSAKWWRIVATNDRTPTITASGYLYGAGV